MWTFWFDFLYLNSNQSTGWTEIDGGAKWTNVNTVIHWGKESVVEIHPIAVEIF